MDNASAAPQSAAPASRSPLRLSWLHPAGLYSLSAVNFFLRILTLGIYHFWGKTEVRKRLWSGVRIEGEPLVYTGTGKELFLGFLIVFAAVLLPLSLLIFVAVIAFGPDSPGLAATQILLYVVFFFLIGVGIYRAQLYRMSRTTWRGIRGGLEGSAISYAWTYFWTGLLIPLTLGWIVPWRTTRLQGIVTDNMRFGNRPFSFSASSGPLYGRFAIFWLIMLLALIASGLLFSGMIASEVTRIQELGEGEAEPSVGFFLAIYGLIALLYLIYAVAGAWYRAFQVNHFAANTHFEGATFRSSITALGLIGVGVTNLLIIIFSLGMLTPVAQARMARYLIGNLSIEGTVPLGEIAQGTSTGPSRGEGLAQAFDVDLGGF